MGAFFPLAYRAVRKRKIESTERSGQKVTTSYDDLRIKKCLYLETSGNKKTVGKEQFEATVAFYVPPGTDIKPGDLITDIKTKRGVVVEAGPLEVMSAKQVPGLTGKIHHISCKLSGKA